MQIGYARVSTDDQNLNLQLDALTQAGCEKVFRDEGTSGAQVERPSLEAALAALTTGDGLVAWRLDRLGRSMRTLSVWGIPWGERSRAQSLTEAMNTPTAGGKLVFHIMGTLAGFERSLMAERSKAGMQAARRRGKHIGRPLKLTREQIGHATHFLLPTRTPRSRKSFGRLSIRSTRCHSSGLG